jgi:phage-related protein
MLAGGNTLRRTSDIPVGSRCRSCCGASLDLPITSKLSWRYPACQRGGRKEGRGAVPRYTVEYYESDSGKCPVEEALETIKRDNRKAWSKCVSYIDRLLEHGLALPRQYMEKVEADLWALRPEWGNVEYRLFFTRVKKQSTFVIVHVLEGKKDEELRPNDVKRARDRVKEVLDG